MNKVMSESNKISKVIINSEGKLRVVTAHAQLVSYYYPCRHKGYDYRIPVADCVEDTSNPIELIYKGKPIVSLTNADLATKRRTQTQGERNLA
jgi:hypothetical protein